MEKNMIEKMDKAYHASMVRLTVFVALNVVFFLPMMALDINGFFVDKPELFKFWHWAVRIIGISTFFIGIWHFVIFFKIRNNKVVKRAVEEGELQQDTGYKAAKFGFFSFLVLSAFACAFSIQFSAYMVLMPWAILLLGTLSFLIAWLYNNRELK